ncbi:MAG: thiamine phosphate synthase [Gemmatimonadaceae bacterium]
MKNRRVMRDFPVVHAVTDSRAVLQEDFVSRASSIMRALGPRGAVHLRSSRLDGRRFHDIAGELAALQDTSGCWLIVNDRVDVARAVGARGAQLASHSLEVADALLVAGNMPVGTSIHSVEEALEAEAAGAAWCVAGTVFETPSHAGRKPARIEFIERVASAVRVPVIAIGGITPGDVPALLRAGAHGVATIRGAAWDGVQEVLPDSADGMGTRLSPAAATAFPEPVTRYISAYDSESGSERNNYADGQRRSPGAGSK